VDIKPPAVLEYLFTNYGTLLLEEVKEKEQEVLKLTFQPSDTMVILYYPIEQLMKLATLADIPYLTVQQIEMGITAVRKITTLKQISRHMKC